jgi:hypothetical protein
MNNSGNIFSQEEINLEVERLKREELEQKVKEELFEKETKEKELQDEMENFLVKFFNDNGVIDSKRDRQKLYCFGIQIEHLFWEKLETYGGFSKCPTCNSKPSIVSFIGKRHTNFRGCAVVNGMKSHPHYFSPFGDSIRTIQCCEHLFDFHQKKRYIKLSKTPFKDNTFIEKEKYVTFNLIKDNAIYKICYTKVMSDRELQYEMTDNPKEFDKKYCNWEEYIPYINTDLVEIPKHEDENVKAKSIAISKQTKEIEILERLLVEAKEKLKALQG